MKRNNTTVRAAHNDSREKAGRNNGKSKYALKVKAGNQMYGPGCWAPTRVTDEMVRKAYAKARKDGHTPRTYADEA